MVVLRPERGQRQAKIAEMAHLQLSRRNSKISVPGSNPGPTIVPLRVSRYSKSRQRPSISIVNYLIEARRENRSDECRNCGYKSSLLEEKKIFTKTTTS
jgi:hypothetical protein